MRVVMPRRAAVARSMTSVVCRPLSSRSVLTSAISGNRDKARRTRGSQSCRSASSSACRVNWYCALAWRPPMRMSCTGTRKRFAPGSCKSLGRSRAITWSTLAPRSLTGFRVMNMKPELRWPPPVKPRAHHRRQRQRNRERDEDRGRERHGELAEQAPDDPAHKEDRDEHRDQRDAHREHGEAHLARALERRLKGLHSALDMARDV